MTSWGCGLQWHPSLTYFLWFIRQLTNQRGCSEVRGTPQWPMRGQISSSWPIRIKDWYTPFPSLMQINIRRGWASVAQLWDHSYTRPARASTDYIFWNFWNQKLETLDYLWRETIQRYSWFAWNIGVSAEHQYRDTHTCGILDLKKRWYTIL